MPYFTNRGITPLPAAGSSWVPSDLGSALRLWVKADTGTSTTGGLIDQINDQSGNNYHLQSNTTHRPPLNATGYNGHPSIDFSVASATFLATQAMGGSTTPVSLNLGSSCSFFFIGQYSTTSSSYARIFSYLGPTTSAGTGVDYNVADSMAAIARDASTTNLLGFQNGVAMASTAAPASTNIRVLMVYDGSANTATIYVNNVAGTPATGIAAFNLGASGVLAIGTAIQTTTGSISNLPEYFEGTIAEMLVTNTALDSTARANLDAYAVARLGA